MNQARTAAPAARRVPSSALTVVFLVLAAAAQHAAAQAWPTKPIRLVVPYPPGGATDIISRGLADKMTTDLKQAIYIDNRGGGGQVIGSEIVAHSAPDGYTILLNSVTHSINPALLPKLPYDTVRDFTPVSFVGSSPLVLVVNPTVPAANMKEFIALARSQPGKLDYASSGTGSGGHLTVELLKSMANIDLVHVPYSGAAPATTDLVGGRVHALFTSPLAVLPQVKAGKLRLLAISSKTRSKDLPDTPTVAESGVPGFESSLWYGILGPRALPRDIVGRMNASIRQGLAAADLKSRFEASGVEAQSSTPEEFAAYIASEMAKWKAVIEKANIKPD